LHFSFLTDLPRLVLFAVLAVFAACTSVKPDIQMKRETMSVQKPTPLQPQARTVPIEVSPHVRASEIMSHLSIDQKVGQLMMVGFAGTKVDASISSLVKGKQVGGVCIFARNIQSAIQVAQLNDDVRELLHDLVPPFIAVDQEGGNVVRVDDGNFVLPGNMVLGATRNADLAYQAGRAQGEDLRRLGFNMNLAPVLDVNSNPQNPVIGIRAFSDNVDLVSQMGAEFVRGQIDANIATVAKHFPGHGGVDTDSHLTLPVVHLSEKQMIDQLRPFSAAMKVGLDGLMTAHIATPNLSGDQLPATLSHKVLSDVLRGELKFTGMVLTDELEMDAIDARYGIGKAAVLAVNAGADMVLVPWRAEKKEEVFDSLKAAVVSGEISSARLDEAVLRILETKVLRGIFEALPSREERLKSLGEKRELAVTIAEEGTTLLKTSGQFPLQKTQKIVVISAESALAEGLRSELSDAVTSFQVPAIPPLTSRNELKLKAKKWAALGDVVVVGIINSRQLELVTMAKLSGKPVVAVVLGNPYLASQIHDAEVVLVTYSYRKESAAAAASALAGRIATKGVLPVALPGYQFGSGIRGAPLKAARAIPVAPASVNK
jgi:beta-N-acetylhexosaminidase